GGPMGGGWRGGLGGLEVGCGGFVRLALAFILYLCNFARQGRRVQVNAPAPARLRLFVAHQNSFL
ncbi:MAG: hypothetical protein PUE10_07285, partial [Bacteroidales bacterium]|nr:hypothetical protein [Bacteroidales bacterium]